MKNMEDNKYLLIEKIASATKLNCNDESKKNTALKIASQMLKLASEKQKNLEIKLAELSLENAKFKEEKIASEKTELAISITDEMFEKGIIKKADIDDKLRELSEIDKTALEVLKNTLASIPEKTANEYVSDLNFLYGNNNIKEKENLSSAINSYLR